MDRLPWSYERPPRWPTLRISHDDSEKVTKSEEPGPCRTTAFPDYVSLNSLSAHRHQRRAQPFFSSTYMGPTTTATTKRRASRSPSERSAKRHAASSPEEGEVDDGSPSQPSLPVPAPSVPPKHASLPAKPKIAFPFKTKGGPSGPRPTLSAFESKDGPAVYERSASTEDRFSSRHSESSRRPRHRDNYENRNPSPERRRRQSPRPRHDYRSRSRTPRSHRSRSPSSPHHLDKHRLPEPRSPSTAYTPYSRNYSRDAGSRTGGYDVDDYDRRRRVEPDRNYSRDGDRHYRPQLHPRDDYHTRPDDRWSSNGRDERDYSRTRDYGDRRRWDEPYPPRRPHTPSPPPSRPTLRPPEPVNIRSTGPPPQPQELPPPPPPPDARLSKDVTLPDEHRTVSIALKRPPPTSQDAHPPLPPTYPSLNELLQKKKDDERKKELDDRRRAEEEERKEEDDRRGEEERKREDDRKREQGWKKEDQKEVDVSKLRPTRKREPVQRTAEEEMKAYGRNFVGCGAQSDYDITTKLGEGTFGEVHKAIHKTTRNVVALKRILMHNEKEGMPVTALREIKILKALSHPSIVDILDMFVVRSSAKDPLSVYMVFPYMDHDLAGLLENDRVKLVPSQIKLYMKQLLEGTEYMHRNHILHRDMKAANLLISNAGSLRIADFGLARAYDTNITRTGNDGRGKERKYTNCVVTRWYRPPELLLGARQYGGEVDIWGIGCVLGEMINRRPILPGNSDLDQLEKIWILCGTPNQHTWPNFDALPGCEGVKRFTPIHSRRVKAAYESVGTEFCDLLDKMLICNPRERITAAEALDHEYFWTEPLPADPKSLPSYEASHEFDKRGQRNHHPPPMQHPIQLPQYNLQNVSRGRTGQDFRQGPNRNNNNNNNNNRHMPYPPPHHGPPQNGPPHHGPPPHGPSHLHGPPHGPSHPPPDLNPDYRGRPNQPMNQHRPGGGGGRGPPPHNYNNPNNRPRGPVDNWVPRQPPQLPSHLPPRPPAPMGVSSRPREPSRQDNSAHPPPSDGGEEKLNYG
ncbi:hypothetical protein DXG01_001831 [Tephrocybe rancida]|nr:hypothetical protein DXG01_001831 [Tephrocybe rancida]